MATSAAEGQVSYTHGYSSQTDGPTNLNGNYGFSWNGGSNNYESDVNYASGTGSTKQSWGDGSGSANGGGSLTESDSSPYGSHAKNVTADFTGDWQVATATN